MNQEKVGELIKNLRKKANLTQSDFAEKYGVSYQAVSKWENGKNIPDIQLLKQICSDYKISLDSVLNGEEKKTNKKNTLFYILITLIVMSTIIILVLHFIKNDIKFKNVTSDCKEFNIYGSLVYAGNNSHLHLSNLTYCGKKDDTVYDSVECNLYEKRGDTTKVLETCKNEKNISLEEYLEKIEFDLKNFSKSCTNYTNNSLYIEISAKDIEGKTTSYKIPLKISETCK